jgi:hypothetical protein
MAANFILIPKMDYLAACWATLLSDFSHYWICIGVLRKTGFSIHPVKLMGIPALGSALSGFCLYLSRSSSSTFHIIPFILLAIAIYVGIVSFFRYITKDEIFSLINPENSFKK